MSIILNGTTGITTPDVTSDGSLKIDASAPDDSLVVDASGNLLVGTTSSPATLISTSSTEGFAYGNGLYQVTSRTDGATAYFNRLNSNGDIAVFRKDGTTVGSIAVANSDLHIGQGDTNLRFNDGSNEVIPTQGTGGTSDNITSLGSSSRRFKDIYLGGGVYLGGTGAANHLDDYEEGTWTPEFSFSGGGSVTYSTQSGSYTKIGHLVTVTINLIVSGTSSPSGDASIGNLPFSSPGGSERFVASGAVGLARNFNSSGLVLRLYKGSSGTEVVLSKGDTNQGHVWLAASDLTASTLLYMTLTYPIS
jgi:hypothetical protein